METLRIGLLVCDHVAPALQDLAGDYSDMFRDLFSAHPEVELIPYDLTAGRFPESIDECEGWLSTGSRRSVYEDEPWIVQFGQLVKAIAVSDVPFVGVCFGHQMMAHALGGEVVRSERGWGVGVKQVMLHQSESWMSSDEGSFFVVNSHADQIVALPSGAEVLGGNDHCPISLMTIGDRMLGIQGHPEFSSEFSKALMEIRRGSVIPEGVVDDGLASLDMTPDRALLADWIVSFLVEALELGKSSIAS